MFTKKTDRKIGGYFSTKTEAHENAIKELYRHGEKETKNQIKKIIKAKIRNRFFNDERIRKLFKKIFNLELFYLADPYMYSIGYSNLNIILFDKLINTPDGISTRNFVRNKYGIKALKLIEKIL